MVASRQAKLARAMRVGQRPEGRTPQGTPNRRGPAGDPPRGEGPAGDPHRGEGPAGDPCKTHRQIGHFFGSNEPPLDEDVNLVVFVVVVAVGLALLVDLAAVGEADLKARDGQF